MPSNRVAAFVPSISGLHFSNSFSPGTSYPVVTLPVVGSIISGDAGNGLCGGFVFTVLDMFTSDPKLEPPATASQPPDPSPLFNYLCSRLLDSFGPTAYANALKAIQWIQTPSHDVDIPLQGPGLGHRMVFDEWPAIKADIDAGRPSPIFLVMAPQCGVGDIPGIIDALGHGHQVLVYGYNLDAAQNVTLQVYDPNDPTNDNSTISFNIAVPAHTITITAPGIEAIISDPTTIRGLFRAGYNYKNPTSLGVTPYPGAWGDGDRWWVGSFTAPNASDLLYYWPTGEQWWLGTFNGNTLNWTLAATTTGFGNTASDPAWTGNFTGTGRSEVLFYSPGDQNWWLGTFNGNTLSWTLADNTRGFGNTSSDPTWIGNFTGTGRSEVLFYSPGDQNWWLGTFNGNTMTWSLAGNTRGFGNTAGDPTWIGNFTGANAQVLFYSGSDQHWWLGTFNGNTMTWSLASNTSGFGNTAGDPTWVGNFTGTGHNEVLFYSPSDENWWLGTFNGNTMSWSLAGNTRGFGNTASDPTRIGNFTGTGRSEVLFYSGSDQHWWLGTFNGNTMTWSLAGDTSGFGNTGGDATWIGNFTGGDTEVLFYSPGDTHWWLGQLPNGQLNWSLVAKIGT